VGEREEIRPWDDPRASKRGLGLDEMVGAAGFGLGRVRPLANALVAQLDRASDFESEGREFAGTPRILSSGPISSRATSGARACPFCERRSVIVWDLETVPDLRGLAAANGLAGKTDDEVREAIRDKLPKHIYHSIVCIGALVARREGDHWAVRGPGSAPQSARGQKRS
jgi:hypothetical protein